jgi:hypothetical protein
MPASNDRYMPLQMSCAFTNYPLVQRSLSVQEYKVLTHCYCQSVRFRVVYRLVSGVYVMAVAPVFMNIFFSTQLVNAIVHRLCTINRSVTLTPEKLTSRFPEVKQPPVCSYTPQPP